MKLATMLLVGAALCAAGVADARRFYYPGSPTHRPHHPPPITCHPPKVAREVTTGRYHNRHEWRCVRP